MTLARTPRFLLTLLLALPLALAACDNADPVDDEDDDDPPPALAPTFSVASVPQECTDGPCIEFYAQSSEDVILVSAVIRNPVGSTETYNLQSQTYLANEPIALQASGLAYTRIGGVWTFTFTGRRAVGSTEGFTATTTVTVSSLAGESPAD